MNTPSYIEVNHAIRLGHLDESLDGLTAIILQRKQVLAAEKAVQLKTGMEFFLVTTIKPKLLAGARCRVLGKSSTKIRVELLETRSEKWRAGSKISVPRTLIGEVIE